jgi:hypothetical protein
MGMSKERTWTDFWEDVNDAMVPDQRNDIELAQVEEADLIRKYNASRDHPISEKAIEVMKKNGMYDNWIERIRNPEPVKLEKPATAPPLASMVVTASDKEASRVRASLAVNSFEDAKDKGRDVVTAHVVASPVVPPVVAIPLEKPVPHKKEDPVERISLSGRELFNDLLADVDANNAEHLNQRFKETIKGAITGYGNEDDITEVSLTTEEVEALDDLVETATIKLDAELDKESKSSSYWKYTNSVEKATQKRWAINFVGHAYDAVGSMCHGMGKMLGLSSPTAAELFTAAAQYAEALKGQLLEKQTDRDDRNREEGERSHVQYYDLKRRGQDRNIEERVKDHGEEVAKHSFSKLVEQVGHKAAEDAMAHGLKYKEKPIYPSFDALYNVLKASSEADPKHKKELQNSDVYLAMAEVQAALFPDDLVTTNITVTNEDLIAKKTTHEIKVNPKEVRYVLRELESVINAKGNESEKAAFKIFKDEVQKNMPKRKWVEAIRENIGFGGKRR